MLAVTVAVVGRCTKRGAINACVGAVVANTHHRGARRTGCGARHKEHRCGRGNCRVARPASTTVQTGEQPSGGRCVVLLHVTTTARSGCLECRGGGCVNGQRRGSEEEWGAFTVNRRGGGALAAAFSPRELIGALDNRVIVVVRVV